MRGTNIQFRNASFLEQMKGRSEGAWKAVADRRLEDEERLSEIFDQLIVIRNEIAINAGFETYTDYMFRAMERFDYTKNAALNSMMRSKQSAFL